MQLGIFAKTFSRPTLAEVFRAVHTAGFTACQFNFSAAGLPTLPNLVPENLLREIGLCARQANVQIAALSGTFNMIDPNESARAANINRFGNLICAAEYLEAPVVTLCTGTRDAQDMWQSHPANNTLSAWNDLVKTLEQLLPPAERARRILAIEPETAHVIQNARKARRLLDELRSPSLKVVFDGANLLHHDDLTRQKEIWTEAFGLLAQDIALVHAKDLVFEPAPRATASGQGAIDLALYFSMLREIGYGQPLILHGMTEAEVPASIQFVRQTIPIS